MGKETILMCEWRRLINVAGRRITGWPGKCSVASKSECAILWGHIIRDTLLDTFTIRDLRERTGELVRDAEAGELVIVTKRGRPLFVAVPFNEALLRQGVTIALAAKLYQDEILTLARAARLAGLSVEAFIEKLGQSGVTLVDYPPDELDQELTQFG